MRQEFKVESVHTCNDELQQQTCAQRLELQDAHHGNVQSRREQVRLQAELGMKEKHFEILRLEVCTRRELKNYESTNSSYTNYEKVMTRYRDSLHKCKSCKRLRIAWMIPENVKKKNRITVENLSHVEQSFQVLLDTWDLS